VTTRDRRMRKFFFLVNWWARQVQEVGTDVGEKTIRFCQKRSPNCNFLILHSPSTYPLSITYDGWDRQWGVRRTRFRWEKFSIVFTPYSIDKENHLLKKALKKNCWSASWASPRYFLYLF
jgi:hypothetical protein